MRNILNAFIIIFSDKLNMKLVVVITLLALFVSINALKMSRASHLSAYLETNSLVVGDSLMFNDNLGDLTITYKFNGQTKTATYTLCQYNTDYGYIIWLFIQKGSTFKADGEKKVDTTFQWGRINKFYFMVQQDATLRSHKILQSILYEAGQKLSLDNDPYANVQKVLESEKNLPFNNI